MLAASFWIRCPSPCPLYPKHLGHASLAALCIRIFEIDGLVTRNCKAQQAILKFILLFPFGHMDLYLTVPVRSFDIEVHPEMSSSVFVDL